MTRREQIIQAVMTALGSVTSVSGIYRSRLSAFQKSESPAINVIPSDDPSENPTTHRLQWALILNVQVLARGESPDAVADEVVEDVHAAIMSDSALNALVVDRVPAGTSFEFFDAEQPSVIVNCAFRLSYQTALADLSTV